MAASHRRRGPRLDPHEIRTLYEAVFTFAWRALERLGVPEADRDDLAQRVVVKAWAGWAQFNASRGTPGQWLWGIVRNELRAHARTRRRRPDLADPDPITGAVEAESPEESMELEDLVAAVWERVPEAERTVVWLHVVGEFTFAEIAEMEGISRSKAERLHKAGMARLRAAIERSRGRGPGGAAVVPLSMAALFDIAHAPAPPPEVIEHAWQRAAAELGLDGAAESQPAAGGMSSGASSGASSGTSSTPIAGVLGSIAVVVLGVVVAIGLLRGRDREPVVANAAVAVVTPSVSAAVPEASASPAGAVEASAMSVSPGHASPPVAGQGGAGSGASRDRERALALLREGREALEAGNAAVAIAVFAQHAQLFAGGAHAAERDRLLAAACAQLRGAGELREAGALARCAGKP
jgi:RNA polymerase sigma factor (sigma-70 family)